MSDQLLVGAAEVDITPRSRGVHVRAFDARPSIGVEDPLTFKAIVLESGGVKIAYVLADLIAIERKVGDPLVAAASKLTGIPASHIVFAASHTHTGPYTWADNPATDQKWLATLPDKFATSHHWQDDMTRGVRRQPTWSASVQHPLIHNRRLKYKDGREINTWLLHSGEDDVQSLGSAAPIDPEVGILSFDDAQGVPIAILWHYTVHTNANFGPSFSADFPGVVGARLRERFGPNTVPIFMPGAFGDINGAVADPAPTRKAHRLIGDEVANVIIQRLNQRKPRKCPTTIAALKQEIVVPFRDFTVDQEERILRSQWPKDCGDVFRNDLKRLREEGKTEGKTIIQAWRIGDIGFASLPGEIFIEWGLKIKAESPFPWTFPIFMGGDTLGYLVTEQAWQAGGYESPSAAIRVPASSCVALMTDTALSLLEKLWKS